MSIKVEIKYLHLKFVLNKMDIYSVFIHLDSFHQCVKM